MKRVRGLDYLIPFMDPDYDPNHPLNHPPVIEEDPYDPLGKLERKRRVAAAVDKAISEYQYPHVVRSYEADRLRSIRHEEVLALRLTWGDYGRDGLPSPILQSRLAFNERYSLHDSRASRRGASPYDPDADPEHTDYRQFAVSSLHLGYHRFHPSTASEGDDYDPPETSEPDICWLAEYTEHECTTIRRMTAKIMGLYPAVTDKAIAAYDEEIAWKYENRMLVKCHRFRRFCVRPSHLRIYTKNGVAFP